MSNPKVISIDKFEQIINPILDLHIDQNSTKHYSVYFKTGKFGHWLEKGRIWLQ